MTASKQELKGISTISIWSLLNLTVLPVIGFIVLFYLYRKAQPDSISEYYAVLGIKTNIAAGLALIVVTSIMLFLGGIGSPWTWMYVLLYFVSVHAAFILFSTWTLTKAWAGKRLKNEVT